MQNKGANPVQVEETSKKFNRSALEELLKRRYFYAPAFSIYNGVKGLYDFGPPGASVKNNLLQLWRQHFILNEGLLEIETTAITPEVVFKASGHVDKFQDFMVKDKVTGDCFRADHLLEQTIDQILTEQQGNLNEDQRSELVLLKTKAGSLSSEELAAALSKYNAKSPDTGNEISEPFPFNLMFPVPIGPTSKELGYLRPETAQGIFVNFKRLLEYNSGHLPFGAAQIGLSFRNEISPRSALLRVREFTMAEIEYFLHPQEKDHPQFNLVRDIELNLYPIESQMNDNGILCMKIGDAVAQKIVANETLGYFLARTQCFLQKVGIQADKLRFRQHLRNEMAHYACDCWDAEIETSYGWIECVGNADRSAYDLSTHSAKSGELLVAFNEFKEGPRMVDVIEYTVSKSAVGKMFLSKSKIIFSYLEKLASNQPQLAYLKKQMETNGFIEIEGMKLTPDLITFKQIQKKLSGEFFVPSVIEPSFGIGRIMYCIFEHCYRVRPNDEQRAFLSLKPSIAPIKVSVLPLMPKPELQAVIPSITDSLVELNISFKVDDSSTTIGRRYARTDEIGIPFGITIDYTTLTNQTVTLRERDSTEQVRIPIPDVAHNLSLLVSERFSWDYIRTLYPLEKA
ncbi:glycine--tRNA ligase-like [Schistocerca gregaria]|uniref:glycine--tRNA ligase-like n=1 Tax=Schistocerca gregaria TaxID=7010 RepID=UPI00211F0C11|nr:glycine--tRNA ligase-like [Schistocerca gregaria]XP_049849285.1 glycine--tRNA ligase-like [Schistocerca gregaria]